MRPIVWKSGRSFPNWSVILGLFLLFTLPAAAEEVRLPKPTDRGKSGGNPWNDDTKGRIVYPDRSAEYVARAKREAARLEAADREAGDGGKARQK